MGWFSKKKKIFVSSVTYNLAGDEKDRVKFLPTTIVTKVLSNNDFSMTDALTSTLLAGPGIRMRSFARWAKSSGYSAAVGLRAGRLIGPSTVDVEVLAEQIEKAPDEVVSIDYTEIDGADYSYWAEQWMADNHPELIDAEYELDFTEAENTIFIKFPDGMTYNFQPVGFDTLSQYLYANYYLTKAAVAEPVVVGPLVPVDSGAEFPDTTGWDLDSNVSTPVTVDLVTTVVTVASYSDGRPDESTTVETPSSVTYGEQEAIYSKTDYQGNAPGAVDEITSIKSFQHNMRKAQINSAYSTATSTETLPGGVVKTTTTTTTTQSVGDAFSYRVDTQKVIDKRWSARHTFIYKFNSGNAVLDAMFAPDTDNGTYFPFIPVRKDERMLDPNFYGSIYARNIKAYKKAFGSGSKYTGVVRSLSFNGSIRDVDYAYILFGVSLNTRETASLKYVYKFFQTILQQGYGGGGFDAWQARWNQADARMRAWVNWKEAQSDPTSPLFGTAEPPRGVYPPVPVTKLKLASSTMDLDMSIRWNSMSELVGTGLGRPGAKVGDVWWTLGTSTAFNEIIYSGGVAGVSTSNSDSATITWQDGVNSYRSISTRGLHHNYMIYKGKGVDTSISDCLNDGEVSGFVLPMNEAVFRSMSLVDSTQMSQANAYMVLNSYTVVKQKWYQTGWFKIILVIIVIVITVVTAGSGAGAGAGLLGTAAGVGAALGFTGVVAIIVGTIANAIAAMLLTQILMMGATKLFGDKLGPIIGAIAAVVAISVGSGMASGEGASAGFANLGNAENIMKLTVAAGNGLAEYVGAQTKDIMAETQKLMDEYADKEKDILDTYEANLGLGEILFDPIVLTDASKYQFIPESSEVFLSRTLLTGSEIAGMTNDLLTNFASVTLSNELH